MTTFRVVTVWTLFMVVSTTIVFEVVLVPTLWMEGMV